MKAPAVVGGTVNMWERVGIFLKGKTQQQARALAVESTMKSTVSRRYLARKQRIRQTTSKASIKGPVLRFVMMVANVLLRNPDTSAVAPSSRSAGNFMWVLPNPYSVNSVSRGLKLVSVKEVPTVSLNHDKERDGDPTWWLTRQITSGRQRQIVARTNNSLRQSASQKKKGKMSNSLPKEKGDEEWLLTKILMPQWLRQATVERSPSPQRKPPAR